MSYNKQNFADGKPLTAKQLENLENEVIRLAEEGTPSSGGAGGVYVPSVQQTSANAMTLAFVYDADPTGDTIMQTISLPSGEKGDKGDKGDPGQPGANGAKGADGVGISSVTQVTTSTQDGGSNVIAVTKTDGTVDKFTVRNGSKGSTGEQGIQGEKGDKGDPGENGSPGAKGDKGDKGDTGATGAAGTSVTVKSVSTSNADGGDNVVTFSDGKTLTVKNGTQGSPGAPGEDGHTPVKGVDYYTEADKAEFSEYIASELAKRGQLKPEYANSIEECTDTSKLYVLPDGYIYAWMLTEKEVTTGPSYTNRLPTATDTDRVTIYNGKGYKENTRLSGSTGSTGEAGTGKEAMCASGFIFPVVAGDKLRIKGAAPVTGSTHYVVGYDSSNARTGNDVFQYESASGVTGQDLIFITAMSSGKYTIEDDGTLVYTINTAKLGANVNAVRICMAMDENTIVTLNEEIAEGGGTTIVKEYAWASTGRAFVPADYEDRIVEVEKTTAEHTKQITELHKAVESGTADDTEEEALNRIKVWDKPVYDTAPVTLLGDDRIKPALTAEDRTIEAIYAKYRALRDDPHHPENALYITETNLGLCTVSDLVPGFTGKDMLRFDFCEPAGLTEVDDPSTPKVPDPARETKPKIIFISGIHKEWAGVYGLYYALEEIANNPEFDDIRRNAHIIVIPCANPFGLIAEYTDTVNGWAAPTGWSAPSHVNANGIAPHNNFGVGYVANQNAMGSYNHGGSSPYSELETQYIDKVVAENSDAIAFVSCHNYNNGGTFGHEAIWASSATYHMCNLVYRLVDKLSKAWVKKYGDTLKQAIDNVKTNVSASEYRLGRATMSTSAGTEQANATKYGILATNLEISDKWVVFSDTQFSSEAMTHGAEVYANFIRTILQAYDHKDKKDYAPNLPWSE